MEDLPVVLHSVVGFPLVGRVVLFHSMIVETTVFLCRPLVVRGVVEVMVARWM
jgi:hypothetical protein